MREARRRIAWLIWRRKLAAALARSLDCPDRQWFRLELDEDPR